MTHHQYRIESHDISDLLNSSRGFDQAVGQYLVRANEILGLEKIDDKRDLVFPCTTLPIFEFSSGTNHGYTLEVPSIVDGRILSGKEIIYSINDLVEKNEVYKSLRKEPARDAKLSTVESLILYRLKPQDKLKYVQIMNTLRPKYDQKLQETIEVASPGTLSTITPPKRRYR